MNYTHSSLLLLVCFCGFFSCKKETSSSIGNPNAMFELQGDSCGIVFTNSLANTQKFNIFSYRNFYNGGGVGIADINNDGLSDVYMTSNLGKNKLYLNKGDFKFEDISETSGTEGTKGWSTGVTMVDVNADGLLDIYVCNAGYVDGKGRENELFINNGDLTFTEKAAEFGLDYDAYTTHAAFFDYDRDGDLDVYLLNNSFIPVNTLKNRNLRDLPAEEWDVKDFLKGGGDKLLENRLNEVSPLGGDGRGAGRFVDVTKKANVYSSLIGFGLGVMIEDVNEDGWSDIYVSNDFYEKDYLYINQKNGAFKEEIEDWTGHLSLASMGTDMADINNDGHPEIFATEMLPEADERRKNITMFEPINTFLIKERDFYHQYMNNTLQLNNGDNSFSDIAWYSGVAATDWSWGALMFDADNDGYRDIYVCNGIYHDLTNQDFLEFFADDILRKMALSGKKEEISKIIDKMPSEPQVNYFFKNNKDLTFSNKNREWGGNIPSFSNGAAYGDLDNDGDLDLVVNNVNQKSFVFKNKGREKTQNNFVKLKLKGDKKNPFAIGTQVRVHLGEQILTNQIMPSRGFQSSMDYTQFFGLGTAEKIDSIVIIWPNQSVSVIENPRINAQFALTFGKQITYENTSFIKKKEPKTQYFKPIPTNFPKHKEDEYIDFHTEPLVMERLSQDGPCVAVGDINGDGKDDILLGGGQGQPTQVYLQSGSGFQAKRNKAFERDAPFEDTACALFDADGDGDLDACIGSGGNHHSVGAFALQDRIYYNNGRGVFEGNSRALPRNGFNTSVVLPKDVDADGDIDLFVGSRSLPQVYGLPPVSFIYINNGKGEFQNAGNSHAPDFAKLGMITDAIYVDVVGDAQEELVVVGQWMAPKVFSISAEGHFSEIQTNLQDKTGWWSSVAAADLNNDGKKDLVLGNRGLNFAFQATEKEPCKLWVNDFDKNGSIEPIITLQHDGKDKPVQMKKELTTPLPGLKKENLRHSDYAQRSIEELFSKEVMAKTYQVDAKDFASYVALNNGNGLFSLEKLLKEAQFSTIRSILIKDINGDGFEDLIVAGNKMGFSPQLSRLDAMQGLVLLNDGKGGYTPVSSLESGFFIKGAVPQMVTLKKGNREQILSVVNGGEVKVFEFSKK